MTTQEKLLHWATQLQGLAQNGLLFAQNSFDQHRFETLRDLAAEMLAHTTGGEAQEITSLFALEKGYATPKVDVRGVVFKDDAILLVKEIADGLWSLPGGWVDVTQSPSDAVVREIFEESGYRARALKLLALYDTHKHKHPLQWPHIYKCFFHCELTGGEPTISNETSAVDFFPLAKLPPMSLNRVLPEQIEHFFKYRDQRDRPTDFD